MFDVVVFVLVVFVEIVLVVAAFLVIFFTRVALVLAPIPNLRNMVLIPKSTFLTVLN